MEHRSVMTVGQESPASVYRACVEFREHMEAGEVDLGEAIEFLLRMSALILSRIRGLLPAHPPGTEQEEQESGDVLDVIREIAAAVRQEEVGRVALILGHMLEQASLMYPRGLSEPGLEGAAGVGTASEEGEKGVLTVVFDRPEMSVEELARFWAHLRARAIASTGTVTVSKLSFVVHLRRLWRAVLTAAKNGLSVKFSAFVATHPRWMRVMDFLALLELLRRGRIAARQDETLGEIEFTLNAGFARAGSSSAGGTRFTGR